MKTVLLMRHAKSSWDDASLADFDRPLNDRGRNTAPFMGRLLVREHLAPEVIIASPARRARETAEVVKQAAGIGVDVVFDERIYEASAQTLAKVILDIDNSSSIAMIVGHNPGMESLIRLLTDEAETMPTAAVAAIELTLESWADAGRGTGKLIRVYRPKDEMRREAGGVSDEKVS